MPAQTKAERYFQPGVSKFKFLTTAVDYTSLTLTEITGSTDLIDVSDVSGFTITSNTIDTPDFTSRFISKIPSTTTADSATITFYASQTGEDVRAILPRDTTGFLAMMYGGDVAGQPMDVFPVTVASLGKIPSNSDAAKIQVDFTITGVPSEDQVIPAS